MIKGKTESTGYRAFFAVTILLCILGIFRIGIWASHPGNENPTTQTPTSQVEETDIFPLPAEIKSLKGSLTLPEGEKETLEEALAAKPMPIDIMMNGKYLKVTTDAFQYQGVIYLPFYSILKLIPNVSFTWNTSSLRADITQGGDNQMKYASIYMFSNDLFADNRHWTMPHKTILKHGNLMIPLDTFLKIFPLRYDFDEVYHILSFYSDDSSFPTNGLESRFYSKEELMDFARLVYKEAGNTSFETIHGVASVIRNHLLLPQAPKTLHEVMYAKTRSGKAHFTPVHKKGFANVTPNYNSVLATKNVLRGENSVENCIYFNTKPFKNTKILKVVDGVYFCY